MTRHLSTCKQRQAALQAAATRGTGRPTKILHLLVDGYGPSWPHLDVRAVDATTVSRIRGAVSAAGGETLSIDLPSTDVNAGSTTREVVDLTVDLYGATIELAAEIGSRWVTLLAGRRHALLPPPDDRLLRLVTDAFDRLVPLLPGGGSRPFEVVGLVHRQEVADLPEW